MKTDWKNKRVIILGAARQGVALARWLTQHSAMVTLSDKRSESELAFARGMLSGLSIQWALGGHPIELLDRADMLCLSGGVPVTLPIVDEALKRGIPLSNDTQIFMEAVPCKTIGITGSAGKTTTTTLVGEMGKLAYSEMQKAGGRTQKSESASRVLPSVFVGGNIGDPLINYVDEMKADDLAILEISSFQLEQMTVSPNIASILNITPNHLDRHGTMEAYAAAKARILEFQSREDIAVLGRDDAGAWNLRNKVKGRLHSFGFSKMDEEAEGTYYDDGILYLYEYRVDIPLLRRDQIQLRGDHNVLNMLAAFAIGHAAGFPLDAMLTAAEEFRGVPHRLEFVRELRGARWYNDSIATAPERTAAAIHSFDEPIVLLLGGRDKDLPWEELAQLIHQRVDHVVLFGEAAGKIQKAVAANGSAKRPYTLDRVEHLHEAVIKAAEVAESGDIVLLSPGGTSFDEFKDFEERGEKFRLWAQELS
ncbi:MAG: UDP-N-acetylmuramoyl-L-alanine--D-glutamate ligase [Chloroflexi bacterium]|nr:UDP-N-acetylmuramoyl-L-alanine--D-glutamate ligase [Chloroflexota bacterium]